MSPLLKKCLSTALLLSTAVLMKANAAAPQINMINDVSHKYTFFFAWKNPNSFGGKHGYVDWDNNQQFQQSQATISSVDLSQVNLYNLVIGAKYDLPYTPKDIKHLNRYIADGGGIFLINSEIVQESPNTRAFLKEYGVTIPEEKTEGNIISANGEQYEVADEVNTLVLDGKYQWDILATDESNNPVIASRKQGKGHVTISSFSPFKRIQTRGKNFPDSFKFPNYELVQPILQQTASGKTVAKRKDLASIPTDKVKDLGTFQIRYTDYSTHIVDAVLKDYDVIYPILEKYMGVPMAAGSGHSETFTIDLLATKGSGVSFGKRIGISMFNDNYFGILGHELTHSWVTPHGEPLSGEGIAIHVGSKTQALASKKIGYAKGITTGTEGLQKRIDIALKDPTFSQWDPVNMNGGEGVAFGKKVTHGKYLHILKHFEDSYGSDVVARYFQFKRKLVPTNNFTFTGNDSVWLWGKATGKDQFAYFNKIGIKADKSKVTIPAALGKS